MSGVEWYVCETRWQDARAAVAVPGIDNGVMVIGSGRHA